MAKIDLDKIEEETPSAPLAEARPATLISKPETLQELGLSGEFTRGDVNLPRLNIAAKTGMLGDEFGPGNIVLNKEVVIAEKSTEEKRNTVEIVPLHIEKRWQEKKTFGGDMPRVWNTLEEAAEDGFADDYRAANRCVPLGDVRLLVRQPDGLGEGGELFPYVDPDDTRWAMVMYTVSNTAYQAVVVPMVSRATTQKTPLPHQRWLMSSHLAKYEENTWWAPKLSRLAGGEGTAAADLAEGLA